MADERPRSRLPERGTSPAVQLRRWLPVDAPVLHRLILENIDHLRPWMVWIALEPLRVEDRRLLIAEWTRQWESGGDVAFSVAVDGRVVGAAGLHRRGAPDTLEIGYWVDRRRQGHGIATAASHVLTGMALAVPGIDKVVIRHDVTNIASGRVPEKLGYRRVGEVSDGRPQAPADTGVDNVWEMTRSDWNR